MAEVVDGGGVGALQGPGYASSTMPPVVLAVQSATASRHLLL